jgi:hypothetical protein
MLTGHRPVMRRRTQRSRAARIAIPLAIPVALGLTLGIVIAVSSHPGSTRVNSSAFGATTSASPSASGSASASTAASPAAATVQALPVAARTFAQADVAGTNAQDAAGNAISFNQTPAQAAASMNCTLAVPANALTAQGLATPWQLGDGCQEAQQGGTEGAFVEATILSPNGQLQIYDPLVITAGTRPAVAPTAPTIAAGSQVIIDVGFNGNALALTGAAAQANCIDALGNSLINQTPTCNARAFYGLANQEIAAGTLKVPAAGTSAADGQACQTTTSFATIDQDQSDNVVGSYLINANTGQTAQNTAANAANLQGFTALGNGSDDGLLAKFIDPALGCTPFTAPNPTSTTGTSGSQALDVLSARQNQTGTTALLPVNDPQLLVGGKLSIQKTNVYRAQVDQPLLSNFTNPQQNAATYCQNMINIQTPKLKLDAATEANFGTPVPALGANLATALANRLLQSFGNLNCGNFGLTNPITAQLDGNGVLLSATYNTTAQTAKVPGGGPTGGTAWSPGGFGGGPNTMPGHRPHM